MEPSRKDIADLFSVVFPNEAVVNAPARKGKGDSANESAELGAQSLNEGDYDQAIRHFQRAIEQRDTADPADNLDLGGAYEFADREPEALRQYEKAVRIDEKTSEARVGISQLYKRKARYKDSLKHLEDAIRIEPHNPFYHFKMAEILREIGDTKGALRSAKLATLAAPEDSFYHFWTGDLLIELKRFTEALESLKTAIELSPGDDYLYLRAGVAFWGANKRPEAVKSVRLASDLDPDKNLYHGVLELFLSQSSLQEEAGLEASRASQMDDYDREALRRIAEELGLPQNPILNNTSRMHDPEKR